MTAMAYVFTFKQILFFFIEAVTSSSLELNTGLISEKKYVSKSMGTFAALISKTWIDLWFYWKKIGNYTLTNLKDLLNRVDKLGANTITRN